MTDAVEAVSRRVSRETLARLEVLSEAVRQWNPRINLVAQSTVEDIWARHIRDSLQLVDLAPTTYRSWADLGSGGGFPGLVVAAALAETNPAVQVVLVESDRRKAAFLAQTARAMDVNATVHAERIERLNPLGADVVSARALAPLPALLGQVIRHLGPGGTAILPKGARHRDELAEAAAIFRFAVEVVASNTDTAAAILVLTEIDNA
ncbi:MAG: 16S rRNA (guanine(527)-N(7))-methyltransferase RsmG [Gemmobacter sp.]